MSLNLLKYFQKVVVQVPLVDFLAATILGKSDAEYYLNNPSKKSADALDRFHIKLKIDFKNSFLGRDCILHEIQPDDSCSYVSHYELLRRIKEIDDLMQGGRQPPPGFRVHIYQGLLSGKVGIIVKNCEDERVQIRFHDDNSKYGYVLECSIRNCRLLSGAKLEIYGDPNG